MERFVGRFFFRLGGDERFVVATGERSATLKAEKKEANVTFGSRAMLRTMVDDERTANRFAIRAAIAPRPRAALPARSISPPSQRTLHRTDTHKQLMSRETPGGVSLRFCFRLGAFETAAVFPLLKTEGSKWEAIEHDDLGVGVQTRIHFSLSLSLSCLPPSSPVCRPARAVQPEILLLDTVFLVALLPQPLPARLRQLAIGLHDPSGLF